MSTSASRCDATIELSDLGGYDAGVADHGISPSRRELQRAASVNRIVAAAESLLSESEQYSELSVERVISRAGVSRSTFYSYFDDMGHLLRALGQGVLGEVVQAARRWMDLQTGVTEEELYAIFANLIETYRTRAKLMAALAEASVHDRGVRDEFHRLFTIGHSELAKHIRQGQRAGFARKDLDPETSAAWLVWMVERGLYQQVRPARSEDVERHVASLTSIVWHALYVSPAKPTTRSPTAAAHEKRRA